MNSVPTSDSISTNITPSKSKYLIRIFAQTMAITVLIYLLSRYLIFWQDWPSINETVTTLFSSESESESQDNRLLKGIALLFMYALAFIYIIFKINKTPTTSLSMDADKYKAWAFYIVRAAFWAVFLIGIADTIISFLRVEELLTGLVGTDLSDALNQPKQRAIYVHYPLIILSLLIASLSKSLGFIWLAFLVVLAEFTIVLTRFIFSYEQSFMGDLVRFWYASFFLFASAYSLAEEGHVRVDVLYARINNRKKAWVNAIGSLVLGLPLCWTILYYGMNTKQSSLLAPIINYEVSPTGYGMYVKYLMAAFLIVYATSMAIMFVSYFLKSCAYLFNEADAELPSGGEH